MKRIEIEEVNNGYWVKVGDRELVYTSLDVFRMLEEIGKYLYSKKIKVTDN